MAEYGVIEVKDGENTMKFSFANRDAWRDTERYFLDHRPDLKIVDSFFGYALFIGREQAIKQIEIWFPRK
jgi:hypothetical protein